MRVKVGTELEVLTEGEWWEGSVIQLNDNLAKVHYNGGALPPSFLPSPLSPPTHPSAPPPSHRKAVSRWNSTRGTGTPPWSAPPLSSAPLWNVRRLAGALLRAPTSRLNTSGGGHQSLFSERNCSVEQARIGS